MAFTAQWTVTDKSDKTYESVAAFFTDSKADEALVKQHTDIEIGIVLDKVNVLSEDGKSFIHSKTFEGKGNYDKWLEEKEKLPEIDEHLTYTPKAESITQDDGSVLV